MRLALPVHPGVPDGRDPEKRRSGAARAGAAGPELLALPVRLPASPPRNTITITRGSSARRMTVREVRTSPVPSLTRSPATQGRNPAKGLANRLMTLATQAGSKGRDP